MVDYSFNLKLHLIAGDSREMRLKSSDVFRIDREPCAVPCGD